LTAIGLVPNSSGPVAVNGGCPVAGRIIGIALDPIKPNIVDIAAAGDGITCAACVRDG